MSEHYRAPKIVAAATALLLGAGACAASGTRVEAKIANPNGSTLEVDLSDGKHVRLANGTAVAALCVDGDPFTLRATIDSGPYEHKTATHVPRADLEHTSDPFQADKQTPPQDPFGPLPQC